MKLWDKTGSELDSQFEKFTVGNDPILDLEIAKYDVIASIAHVKMLCSINLLSEGERNSLIQGLNGITKRIEDRTFIIEDGIEDCHSQIELELTRELGEVGKKVHSGRSRNDQVLVALKLYGKAQLEEVAQKMKSLFELLLSKSERYKK